MRKIIFNQRKSAPLSRASQRDSALIESAGGSQFCRRDRDTNFEA